ncbi:unnamed protein product [Aphanomyces euteiches]|uniref:Crinkler effector protein N-terminal domain-containing protein n=1 Tax=Aphanomyces euteiches TaxID=100861 RepID=A0A6G0X7L6_9STRA|nr:hypothetical protein Ae201684_007839 [Aphanomyces euteiches]KAH9067146.1 hypothetical protein Ae201684P_021312 [Aphanomyces euteiches]KAH9142712.1 hypothetical protein AeRB84_013234 [Aphanomyces euteiches]
MLTLVCVIVGEGIPFSVKIETDELVDDLKVKIKERIEFSGPARRLELYRVDGLVQKLSSQLEYNGTILDDFAAKTLGDFKGSCVKMAEAHRLLSFPQLEHVVEGEMSILVVHPDITRQTWAPRHQPAGDCVRKTRESYVGRSVGQPDRYSDRVFVEHRGQIMPAVFVILDLNEADDYESYGIGDFFSPTLAVTCDRNLKDEHTVGSHVPVALRYGRS